MHINITCGQYANDYYSKKYNNEVFIPFNEAMIYGNPHEDIFSKNFILERIKTHKTTKSEYMSKMKSFLDLKDKLNQYEITCWFGEDKFCQINLLTLLAYLDQINYKKEITLNLINESTYDIKRIIKINVIDYKQKYLNKLKKKNNIY